MSNTERMLEVRCDRTSNGPAIVIVRWGKGWWLTIDQAKALRDNLTAALEKVGASLLESSGVPLAGASSTRETVVLPVVSVTPTLSAAERCHLLSIRSYLRERTATHSDLWVEETATIDRLLSRRPERSPISNENADILRALVVGTYTSKHAGATRDRLLEAIDRASSPLLPLPRHVNLTIEHNPHVPQYQSALEWLEEHIDRERSSGVTRDQVASPEDRVAIIAANEVWMVTWSPTTPVGSCVVVAATLERALELSRRT